MKTLRELCEQRSIPFGVFKFNAILFYLYFFKALPVSLVDIKPSGAESEWQKQVISTTFNFDIDISFRVSDWGFSWHSDESTRLPAIWPRVEFQLRPIRNAI